MNETAIIIIIGVIILGIAIQARLKFIVENISRIGKNFPKKLIWLKKMGKFLNRPDFLSLYQGVLLIFIFLTNSPVWIIIFSLGALLLDALDGEIARMFPETKTWLGRFLDPAMDKLLIGGTIIKCWLTFPLSPETKTLFVTIIALDILLALMAVTEGVRQYLHKKKYGSPLSPKKIEANYWGKVKRNLQTLSLVILLINPKFSLSVNVSLTVTVFFSVMSVIGHTKPNCGWYNKATTKLAKIVEKTYHPNA